MPLRQNRFGGALGREALDAGAVGRPRRGRKTKHARASGGLKNNPDTDCGASIVILNGSMRCR
jgi:hypothetical protein